MGGRNIYKRGKKEVEKNREKPSVLFNWSVLEQMSHTQFKSLNMHQTAVQSSCVMIELQGYSVNTRQDTTCYFN